MVASRQITEAEKQAVRTRQGLRCFIDDHPIDSDADVEFDHIRPFAEGGQSHADNVAIVCMKHNREKRTLSLGEYRDRLQLRRFFEGVPKRRLDDLLEARLGPGGFGHSITTELTEAEATLYLDSGPIRVPVGTCPATQERYFYVTLPVSVLRNDTELQPRSLEPERLWELYRHLLTHTQLAPAVCRLVGTQMLLFDGQHKVAAQVWAGRPLVECKVYIEPELRRLKETNLSAHDRLRQMPFYTSTLLEKYASMASEDWQAFLETSSSKTEGAFVDFIRSRSALSRAEALKRLRSMIYQDIIEHPQNQLREFIAEENKSRQNPITMYRLEKTFFAEFVTMPPLTDEFESDAYHRDEERENVVHLFNVIAESVLVDRWAPERDDASHRKAARLFSAGALRAWVPMLRDAIAPTLGLFASEERARILYRPVAESEFQKIAKLIERLLSHKVWVDPNPELNDLRYDNVSRAREMLQSQGLTVGWILGGS